MQWRLDNPEKQECNAMNTPLNIRMDTLPIRTRRAVRVPEQKFFVRLPIKYCLCVLAFTTTTFANAGELGRLFFTPAQRTQMDYNFAREVRPDSDNRRSLSVSGIVQKHGGERTVWINGVPKITGKSDERSPESAPVTIPGQAKQIRLKVGQRILLSPSARPETFTPSSLLLNSSKPDPAKQDATDDD